MKNMLVYFVFALTVTFFALPAHSQIRDIDQQIVELNAEASSRQELLSALTNLLNSGLSKQQLAKVYAGIARAHAERKLGHSDEDLPSDFDRARQFCDMALLQEDEPMARVELLKARIQYDVGLGIQNNKVEAKLIEIKGIGLLKLLVEIEKYLMISEPQKLPIETITLGVSADTEAENTSDSNSQKLRIIETIRNQNHLFREHTNAIEKYVELFDTSEEMRKLGIATLQAQSLKLNTKEKIFQKLN